MTIYIYNDCRYINPPAPGASAGTSAGRCLAEQRLDTDDGRRRGRPRPGGNPGEGPKNGRFWGGKNWKHVGKTGENMEIWGVIWV